MRRTRFLVLLGLGTLLTVLVAVPAQAAGYRYWSFWQSGDGRWTYATEGPATARPADGSVHGFRFSVSENSGDAAKPRRAPDFAAICAKTPAKDGTKRVALVIDPGTVKDAPQGETPPALRTACAQVAGTATTAEALAQVAKPLRYNSQALLCAISGYPKSGCGEQLSGPAAKPDPAEARTDDDGPSLGVYAGVAAILTLAAATLWQSRRRKR
ncbi:SCO2322 family protein [Streptomyces peucetius]|uniref:SCO2322 family protein n=1 Tax=Streptomyces peucetius TaxID=1950 RepID=A0ABY6I520_STRPE|nr:SCO2322 family protein [Streptomyces peucetius]UYQ61839.1 SCO2322 family protein [Streptomyces peucetius]